MDREQSRIRQVAESVRDRVLAVTLVGATALALSGCATQEEVPAAIPAFAADPGVDDWPVVPDMDDISSSASYMGEVDGDEIIEQLEASQRGDNTTAFTAVEEDLPSAPVIEFKLGNDGELHYHTEISAGTRTESINTLLRAADTHRETLSAAMGHDMLSGAYVRVRKPNESGTTYGPQPMTYAYFDPSDEQSGNRPALYYNIGPDDTEGYDAVATTFNHEAHHAIFRAELPTLFTPEEAHSVATACVSLREAAYDKLMIYNGTIVTPLRQAREIAGEQYATAFDAVIDGLQNGTYPARSEAGDETESPEDAAAEDNEVLEDCYWQNPIEALHRATEGLGLDDFNPRSLPDYQRDVYQEALSAAEENWSAAIKTHTVYRQLNESTLLDASPDNDFIGHSFADGHEFTASLGNLVEAQPEEMASLIATLPSEQQAKVIEAARALHSANARIFAADPEYTGFVDERYNTFFRNLGARANVISQDGIVSTAPR